jgi:urease accessory protein
MSRAASVPAPGDEAALAGFLSVLQLSDSAFPSGRYTLSYGLETFVQSGAATRPSALLDLLDDCVRFGAGPSDGVALACAHRAVGPDGLLDLDLVLGTDERLTAVKLPREAREASARTGRALLDTAVTAFGRAAMLEFAEHVRAGRTDGNHAVVLGVLSASLGVPRLQAVAGELYAFAAGWVAAAIRLAVIDHRTAQGLLHAMRPVIAEAARRAAGRQIADISSCTPLVDVLSMRHEQAELRLFAS